jgi:hypothetical protein
MSRIILTKQLIADVVNIAADDVIEFVDVNFTDRDRDLVNLLVNVVVHRLLHDEDAEVSEIIADYYESDAEEVLSWLG